MKTLADFRTIKAGDSADEIRKKFGEPEKDIGSGIYIYQYRLEDNSLVWVGFTTTVLYVDHVVDGKKTRLVKKTQ